MRTHAVGIAIAALVLAWTPRLAAQPAADPEALFREALALFDAGKTSEACARFAESFRIDPKNGTLQNLALCHEKEGRRALAWREWMELRVRAEGASQSPRAIMATEHADSLAAALPRVRLRPSATSNVAEIRIDGVALERQWWTEPLPIDPGPHEIVFSAEGKKTIARPLDVKDPVIVELDVPTLEGAEMPKSTTSTRSSLPWIVGGTGVVLVGIGATFGIHAIAKRAESDDECPDERCTERGVELNDVALRSAWIANVAIGAGLIAVGVGAFLLLTSKADAKSASTILHRGLVF